MSGSSLDGLDIAYVHFQETAGRWSFQIVHADCYAYPEEWKMQLQHATSLPALDYQLLHASYGHYIGDQVNSFTDAYNLHHKVDLVSSHGHTTFHVPSKHMTAQLGDGAAIAAVTGLPAVSDIRAMDVAFGGQGAPIVPIGEKFLLHEYDLLLNLGGIANVSARSSDDYVAFDVCPANRVLNLLVGREGKEYDEGGAMASTGSINEPLLQELNDLEYYRLPYPKSLANDFGTDVVYNIIMSYGLSTEDALRTSVEHSCRQIQKSLSLILSGNNGHSIEANSRRLLATGGGALNTFFIKCLQQQLAALKIEVVVPDISLVNFKEALIMAFMGVLRWREEYNVLASVTGARRNSIGGALWLGSEA